MIEQRTPEWYQLRKGKITSSEIHKIMGVKKELSDVAKTYLLERVAELLGGTPLSTATNGFKPVALEWGTELEPVAIDYYSTLTSTEVKKASFIVVNEQYGGSPDGLIPPEGIIEVKCPFSSANHFKHGMIKSDADFKKVAPAYYYQCMSNIICAEAEWCDFISFDPRVQEEYQMFIYRLHRNQEEIDFIKQRLGVAKRYIEELLEKIKECKPVPR